MDAIKEKEFLLDIMSAKYSPDRLMRKYDLTGEEFCRRYDEFRKKGKILDVIDWTWKRQGHLVECDGRSSLGTTGKKT